MSIKQMWNKFLEIVSGISCLISFFLIPLCLGSVVYYTFICYDFKRVLMLVVVLLASVFTNTKL